MDVLVEVEVTTVVVVPGGMLRQLQADESTADAVYFEKHPGFGFGCFFFSLRLFFDPPGPAQVGTIWIVEVEVTVVVAGAPPFTLVLPLNEYGLKALRRSRY